MLYKDNKLYESKFDVYKFNNIIKLNKRTKISQNKILKILN